MPDACSLFKIASYPQRTFYFGYHALHVILIVALIAWQRHNLAREPMACGELRRNETGDIPVDSRVDSVIEK